MLRDDWVVGFTEGEGTFTVHGHWNHTTRGGKSLRYRIDTPTYQVGQKEREVCDALKEFFGFGRVDYKASSDSWEFRVVGYKNCRRVALFFEGRLFTSRKSQQFADWCDKMGLLDDSLYDFEGNRIKVPTKVEDSQVIEGGSLRVKVCEWMESHPQEVARVAVTAGVRDPTEYEGGE